MCYVEDDCLENFIMGSLSLNSCTGNLSVLVYKRGCTGNLGGGVV